MYNGSATLAIMTEFPEHAWELWRFEKVPKGLWQSEITQQLFVDSLRSKILGTDMSDLYKLTTQLVNQHGGTRQSIIRYGK